MKRKQEAVVDFKGGGIVPGRAGARKRGEARHAVVTAPTMPVVSPVVALVLQIARRPMKSSP